MKQTTLRDGRVQLTPEPKGYLVKKNSLRLHHTMIIDKEDVSLWRDATQEDIDAWEKIRTKI